jgi:hypothetical protein
MRRLSGLTRASGPNLAPLRRMPCDFWQTIEQLRRSKGSRDWGLKEAKKATAKSESLLERGSMPIAKYQHKYAYREY